METACIPRPIRAPKSPASFGKRWRVAEASLLWVSALGGWPGGLLGMVLFRHKSAKGSFQLKFAAAFFLWAALVYAAWRVWVKG